MPTLPYGTCVLAAARLPRGGSGRAIPVSCSKTGCGLHSTPVTAGGAARQVQRVDHSRAIHPFSHSATPRPANFIIVGAAAAGDEIGIKEDKGFAINPWTVRCGVEARGTFV